MATNGFWLWYFGAWYRNLGGFVSQAILFATIVGATVFVWRGDPGMRELVWYLVKNPFFHIAWLMLVGSYLDLDYMEHRIYNSNPGEHSFGGS